MALPFLKEDKQRFLDSQDTWKDGLGKGWQGTKFLGMGCFGVTGLWEFKGAPGVPRPSIDKVVVKMAQQFPDALPEGRSALEEGEQPDWTCVSSSETIVADSGVEDVPSILQPRLARLMAIARPIPLDAPL